VMDEISYPDQHGSRRGLGIQTALLPVLEAVRDAELHGTPMQILSVDLKSAFDTISPQLIYKVMELEKFPTIYMDAIHQLTGSGTGRVFANSILGPAFSIGCGTGQGDPPSAGRFMLACIHANLLTYANADILTCMTSRPVSPIPLGKRDHTPRNDLQMRKSLRI
jgi:hypothetical protein